MKKRLKDARSTGRKRGRKVLQESGRAYECECDGLCGRSHPGGKCKFSPNAQTRSQTLDVNHKNKNILDNDPSNLEWLCRSCHKFIDSRTARGIAPPESEEDLYGGLL